ncbi:flagellar biosynthesis protein FliR [Robbsia andropogonis]|uniref:Flagellar biosynthetic protein FliR n=1 Tax=Robbsia andropogonis TaxID=28092 RepID=A0A0F5K2P6_9BURK|nr:flagellar biosynthetic protein FliR [Robbsia andropogonis]KKB64200.1 flagellar biosynthesis protein FliR [Robbsia andropogonis]MCP1118760.1 flagellar biosynthetic protein FliR [Robbsia andropogonis]MCP1128227.1 flagellar biosynthetic protein FliR [Robbsia andropogonis]
MITVTYAQLQAWMGAFIWPFARFLALITTAPVLSDNAIPVRVKVALAALLAILVSPTLGPLPDVPIGSGPGLWALGEQIVIGGSIGVAMRIVFGAVQAAGEYAGLQMGLSFAQLIAPGSDGSTLALSRLLDIFAMLIFLAIDGHLQLIATLAATFQTMPIRANAVGLLGTASHWRILAEWGSVVFWAGLMLSLPIVVALLIANLALGILNRAAPQIGIYQVGFAITLITGFLVLQLILPNAAPFILRLFNMGMGTISRLTGAEGL